jgi:type I restriction enzyme S subunit
LKQSKIAYPSKAKHSEIIEIIDNIESKFERLLNRYEKKLGALEELKKSLLHQAFTGQL